MARPLKPFVRSGGYYPSAKYTPLVYPGGYTTLNAKNGKPEPINTFLGKIVRFLAKRSLPMVKLEANFTPIQNLNGQEAPWPPGGGKNKFDEQLTTGLLNSDGTVSDSSARLVSDFIPVVPGESYAFVWPSISGRGRCAFYDANKDLVQYESDFPPSIIETNVSIFTVPSGAYYLRFNLTSTYGTTYNHDVSINYPSTDHSYHPYSNICPISGHTGCEVVVDGKNLLPNQYDDGTHKKTNGVEFNVDTDGVVTISGQATGTTYYNYRQSTNPITFKAGSYAKLNPTQNGLQFNIYKPGGTQIATNATKTFTLTEDTECYMFLRVASGTVFSTPINVYPMIVLGSTALKDADFVPYSGTTVSISFGQTVYGGQLTVNEDGSGQIDATMAAVDMGTLNYTYYSSYSMFLAPVSGMSTSESKTGLCSALAVKNVWINDPEWVNGDCIVTFAGTGSNIRCKWTKYTDAASFKTAVTGQTLCYELASPVTIPLTASQINTLVGENVVWVNDSDNIQVTAYGSPIT